VMNCDNDDNRAIWSAEMGWRIRWRWGAGSEHVSSSLCNDQRPPAHTESNLPLSPHDNERLRNLSVSLTDAPDKGAGFLIALDEPDLSLPLALSVLSDGARFLSLSSSRARPLEDSPPPPTEDNDAAFISRRRLGRQSGVRCIQPMAHDDDGGDDGDDDDAAFSQRLLGRTKQWL
jgi:hypothetical protein